MHYGPVVSLSVLLAALLLLSLVILPVAEPTWQDQIAAVQRGESDTVHIAQQSISDGELVALRGLTALRVLKLEQGKVSADGLSILADLPQLETLWLRNSRVGNRAIREIVKNRNLAYLNLPQAEFGDTGLELLTTLPHLQQLRFSSPHVTPRGLAKLSQARSLRLLHLFEVPVTAGVLQSITQLDNLESLYIDHPHADPVELEAALIAFFKARPNVHVHIGQQHHDLDPHWHDHGHPHPHPH